MARSNDPEAIRSSASRGRPFVNGNSGRKPGSKNRTTQIAAAVAAGDAERLVAKAVEIAMRGDVVLLKFFLGRIIPRDRVVQLDLPAINSPGDAVNATAQIIKSVSEGKITPIEGAALGALFKVHSDAIDIADLVRRFDRLERQIKNGMEL